MAASIYATPPPDISGEDTALSDVSNSSQLSNQSSKSLSKSLSFGAQSLLESLQYEQSKNKRRKQSTPLRLSASNLPTDLSKNSSEMISEEHSQSRSPIKDDDDMSNSDDYEAKLSKLFLPKLMAQGHINPFEMLQTHISNSSSPIDLNNGGNSNNAQVNNSDELINKDKENYLYNSIYFAGRKQCRECGEVFDSDLKLNVHILHEHTLQESQKGSISVKRPENIKLEREDMDDFNQKWMPLPGISGLGGFPFSSDSLGVSNYLSQIPMLGVGQMSGFSGEGMSRPPMRIFNPEAFCDLCNKEFCNKYFLKTHKANKHGVYDPSTPSEPPSSSNDNKPNPMLLNPVHLQMQQMMQQQQQQQQQSQPPPKPVPNEPPPTPIYCDVCNKKFTNIFAMKRHRIKTHEHKHQEESTSETSNAAEMSVPEGFLEDYTLEQEDVSFAPPPRNMPPSFHSEAKESKFSPDVLKKLGVTNVDAFCTICYKEYCNSYFLRTHKWKRHGISILNDDLDDKQPLNLMLPSADDSESSDAKRIKLDDESEKVEIREIKRERSEEKTTPEPTPDLNYTSEFAGLNLQKLQSMIMQLNDLNGKRPIMCHICGKEMKNQYMLHVHVTAEHMNENHNNNNGMFSGLMKTPPPTSPTSPTAPTETCKQCNKQFNNSSDLKQHSIEVHGLKLDSPVRNGFLTPDRPINPTSGPSTPVNPPIRPTYTITPTSSYCEICNKELCNKYFMKTHMQRMHGIEIENGAQIGGVVCNVCNKELCSKYFLRVHKLNTHGISDDGSPVPNPQRPPITELPEETPFTSPTDNFSEVCLICSRRFRSFKWLKEHMKADHGLHGKDLEQQLSSTKPPSPGSTLRIPNGNNSALNNLLPNILGKNPFPNLFLPQQQQPKLEEPQQLTKDYQCSMCPFTTPYYYFLIIHERSHTIMNNMPSKNDNFSPVRSQDNEDNAVSSERYRSVSPQEQENDGPPLDLQNKQEPVMIKEENINNVHNHKPSSSPKPSSTGGGEKEVMQAFFLKENIEEHELTNNSTTNTTTNQGGNKNRFVPAVVYLPVRERLSSSITVTFTLTPTQPQD